MKKNTNYSIEQEIQFLFKDVIKVNVLTYAAAFKQYTPDDFVEAIRTCESFAAKTLANLPGTNEVEFDKKTFKVPQGYKEAWEALKEKGIFEMLAPGEYGGKNFPDTVRIAIMEILLCANPSFYYYLMLSLSVADLIIEYGTPELKEAYCSKLYSGEWTGAINMTEAQSDCDWGAIEAEAREEENGYAISAEKTMTAAGMHDLTDNIVHLVLARIVTEEKGKLAWFIVPRDLSEKSGSVSNNVHVEACHNTVGLHGTSFCTLSFGKRGKSRGYLLSTTGSRKNELYRTLNGIRTQMALQSVALSGQVFEMTRKFACHQSRTTTPTDGDKSRTNTVNLISYPHIADHVMYMKSISEGLRLAVYSISFFHDCSIHGAKEQNEFFSDLTDLYTGVLKVHATLSGLKAIRKGIQVFGKEAFEKTHLTERNYRDLQAATLFGSSNEIVAQELMDRLVDFEDGRIITNVVKQFESIQIHQAKTEPLKEAIRVWQDYIGGVIVMADDLKKEIKASAGNEEIDPRLSSLWAGRIISLIGDVILAYHLIAQALEAERKLEILGVNFFNLQQEVARSEEAMSWYDRILTAEYFALNVLSENESNIRILQRNASSALQAFFPLQSGDS